MSDDDEVQDTDPQAEGDSAGKSARVPWLPLVIVLLVVPIITIAGMEFVIIPKLKTALQHESSAAPSGEAAPAGEDNSHGGGHGGGHGGEKEEAAPGSSYTFEEIITNLSGTMGTRFIKTSFEVTGKSPDLRRLIQDNKARVRDGIMTVLGRRTIRELEVVGGRNALRVDLIEAINSAIGQSAVEELYFVELIIQ